MRVRARAQPFENFACACVRVRSLLKISRARACACAHAHVRVRVRARARAFWNYALAPVLICVKIFVSRARALINL